MRETCPLCSNSATIRSAQGTLGSWGSHVDCPRCGNYSVTNEAEEELATLDPMHRAELSFWTKERTLHGWPAPTICSSDYTKRPDDALAFTVPEVLSIHSTKSVAERFDRVLRNIATLSREPGRRVRLDNNELFLCCARDKEQAEYTLQSLHALGYLDYASSFPGDARISAAGWHHLAELAAQGPEGDRVFIAMSFDPDLEEVWRKAILPAVDATGLKPIRVDKEEHNEKICDRIISELRRSRAVVADFTRQKQGVYFEAGYGLGLGRPVIWTCRSDDLKNCHFDTRQYNYIEWSTLEELRKRLQQRLEATVLTAAELKARR